jgi:hypothetical protein
MCEFDAAQRLDKSKGVKGQLEVGDFLLPALTFM